MPKPPMYEDYCDTTQSIVMVGDKSVYIFTKSISLKVNETA